MPDPSDIQPTRVRRLNDRPPREGGRYVLYWMQASQRTRGNHALEHAVDRANDAGLPLVCCFGLTDGYPEANARHYHFMVEGLRDVAANLRKRGIVFACDKGEPPEVAAKWAANAAVVVTDMGYVRPCRRWRITASEAIDCELVQIESGVVVPVEEASDKREYAARTLRPKIHRLWDAYLIPLESRKLKKSSLGLKLAGDSDVTDPARLVAALDVDQSVGRSPVFDGGEDAAGDVLGRFLGGKLDGYAEHRNEPANDRHSYMSMYLHFGQISPLELALKVREAIGGDDRKSYLEELIIRRELAKNFVWYAPDVYDKYDCLPDWAKKTLADHRDDDRPTTYTRKQLEDAETRDGYWNAAMDQMRLTGFMHNYMRMYWGKKILEWCNTPEYAYETLLYLNDKYFLDGRDPNSYSNVAWVFGLHDRPWTERPVFGKVRYMNQKGLDRKFDMPRYVAQIDRLRAEHG